jgi:glutamyl-tRNA reductase
MSAVPFLGLGRMGLPMAVNLVSPGHDLTVRNRTPAKAEAFATDVLQDAVRAGYGDLDESRVAEFLRASGPATPAPISRLRGTVEGIRRSTS